MFGVYKDSILSSIEYTYTVSPLFSLPNTESYPVSASSIELNILILETLKKKELSPDKLRKRALKREKEIAKRELKKFVERLAEELDGVTRIEADALVIEGSGAGEIRIELGGDDGKA